MIELRRLIKNGGIDESALDPYQRAFYRAATVRDDQSFQLLAKSVIASLPSGMYSSRGIEKLVRIYFGSGISFISVRADLRCSNDQVQAYQKSVREAMTRMCDSLVSEIERQLQAKQAMGG